MGRVMGLSYYQNYVWNHGIMILFVILILHFIWSNLASIWSHLWYQTFSWHWNQHKYTWNQASLWWIFFIILNNITHKLFPNWNTDFQCLFASSHFPKIFQMEYFCYGVSKMGSITKCGIKFLITNRIMIPWSHTFFI